MASEASSELKKVETTLNEKKDYDLGMFANIISREKSIRKKIDLYFKFFKEYNKFFSGEIDFMTYCTIIFVKNDEYTRDSEISKKIEEFNKIEVDKMDLGNILIPTFIEEDIIYLQRLIPKKKPTYEPISISDRNSKILEIFNAQQFSSNMFKELYNDVDTTDDDLINLIYELKIGNLHLFKRIIMEYELQDKLILYLKLFILNKDLNVYFTNIINEIFYEFEIKETNLDTYDGEDIGEDYSSYIEEYKREKKIKERPRRKGKKETETFKIFDEGNLKNLLNEYETKFNPNSSMYIIPYQRFKENILMCTLLYKEGGCSHGGEYLNKYIKYKKKYLELKNNII